VLYACRTCRLCLDSHYEIYLTRLADNDLAWPLQVKPMAALPSKDRKWMCPNHVDQVHVSLSPDSAYLKLGTWTDELRKDGLSGTS